MKTDVEVGRVGLTIFSFVPKSRKAKRWVRHHIDAGEVRTDGGFYAEQRQARDIAAGMTRSGLKVADRMEEA